MAADLDAVGVAPVGHLLEERVGIELADDIEVVAADFGGPSPPVDEQERQFLSQIVALHLAERLEQLRRPGDAESVVPLVVGIGAVECRTEVFREAAVVFLVGQVQVPAHGVGVEEVNETAVPPLARLQVKDPYAPVPGGSVPVEASGTDAARNVAQRFGFEPRAVGQSRGERELGIRHGLRLDASRSANILLDIGQRAHPEGLVGRDNPAGQALDPDVARLAARPFVLVDDAEQESGCA